MKSIGIATLLSLALLVGCNKGGAESAAKDWSKKACACKDKKCVEDMKKSSEELGKKYEKDFEKMSKEKQAAVGKALEDGEECLMKIAIQP